MIPVNSFFHVVHLFVQERETKARLPTCFDQVIEKKNSLWGSVEAYVEMVAVILKVTQTYNLEIFFIFYFLIVELVLS